MFERLRELRKEKRLTCEDMAKLLGLGTKAAYSKKELGRTKFSLEDARKISCVLGKDIDDIFGKDSVWFTEKEKDGNSSLYSLIDFKGLNKLSSIHRAYMNGQFGALPNVIM